VPVVAVVDTNVLVSAFLNPVGFPARVLAAAQRERFTLVTSAPLLEELREVLSRSRLMRARNTTSADADTFVQSIADVASQVVPVSGTLQLCRDPDDDVLLETAIVGGATHIVSRDEDITRDLELVAQLEKRGIKAVTVSRFLAEVGE
jgi:putative PIN family toxin of toxin-antitoxin system